MGALGGCLIVWAFRSLGPNLTDTVVTRRHHTLITRGPYRWVRHPFYDAVALSRGRERADRRKLVPVVDWRRCVPADGRTHANRGGKADRAVRGRIPSCTSGAPGASCRDSGRGAAGAITMTRPSGDGLSATILARVSDGDRAAVGLWRRLMKAGTAAVVLIAVAVIGGIASSTGRRGFRTAGGGRTIEGGHQVRHRRGEPPAGGARGRPDTRARRQRGRCRHRHQRGHGTGRAALRRHRRRSLRHRVRGEDRKAVRPQCRRLGSDGTDARAAEAARHDANAGKRHLHGHGSWRRGRVGGDAQASRHAPDVGAAGAGNFLCGKRLPGHRRDCRGVGRSGREALRRSECGEDLPAERPRARLGRDLHQSGSRRAPFA